MAFDFYQTGPLQDGDLQLRLRKTSPGSEDGTWAPAYHFDMVSAASGANMGGIDLRVSNQAALVNLAGHIGYRVNREHRGHRYAARSVKLLLPLARRHGFDAIWITCNPDNLASRRTCEIAGGQLVEIVDIPEDNPMYLNGERQKCRYRFDLANLWPNGSQG